jgi:hypothetical protein
MISQSEDLGDGAAEAGFPAASWQIHPHQQLKLLLEFQ